MTIHSRRRRRLPPAARYFVWFVVLALIVMLVQFAVHTYRTEPRDARAFTERELRLTVLRPNERVLHLVSVFRRSPLDYFRATRGVLVLTDQRMVYLGLVPRDFVASPDAPPVFEQREFGHDTLVTVKPGRTFFYVARALDIDAPRGGETLGVPASSWASAEALRQTLERQHKGIYAEGARRGQLRTALAEAKKRAEEDRLRERHHTVMRNETLFSIARRYQTTPEAIQKLNNLPTPRIKVGQRIVVKATS
jgi:hypothetical protein